MALVDTEARDKQAEPTRVSGTEGTAFLGDYGSFTGELQAIDGTLEAEPTDYEVGGDFS